MAVKGLVQQMCNEDEVRFVDCGGALCIKRRCTCEMVCTFVENELACLADETETDS